MSELEQTPQNQPTPTPRRRRKPRRPKWVKNKFTYQLWRNWPLIRLALIGIVVLSILGSLISCSVKAIFGSKSEETTPSETNPPQTTAPPETEPPADELLAQAQARYQSLYDQKQLSAHQAYEQSDLAPTMPSVVASLTCPAVSCRTC